MIGHLYVTSWAFVGDDATFEVLGDRASCDAVYYLVRDIVGSVPAFIRVSQASQGFPVREYVAPAPSMAVDDEDEGEQSQ